MQYRRRRWIRRYAVRRPSSVIVVVVVVCNAFRSRLAYNNSNNVIRRFGNNFNNGRCFLFFSLSLHCSPAVQTWRGNLYDENHC